MKTKQQQKENVSLAIQLKKKKSSSLMKETEDDTKEMKRYPML